MGSVGQAVPPARLKATGNQSDAARPHILSF
jgi:hypothetical protein